MSSGTISVVIPAYNAERFIGTTVGSVLEQARPAHEIIVVDDGSTDGTGDVVARFGGAVRYIRKANSGVSDARNAGIEAATGEWIALLDADDLMLPRKLAVQAEVIEENPSLSVVYSSFTYLYPDGSRKDMAVFDAKELWPALRYCTPILPSTALVKRSALKAIRGFKEGCVYCEDWDIWFRLMRHCGPEAFRSIAESLILYRQWENNAHKSFMPMANAAFEMLDSLLIEDLPAPKRYVWRRKIEARMYYRLALGLRETNDSRYWSFAIESLLRWPLSGRIVPSERYKVLAHMLLTRLRNPRWDARYWWPERRCRQHLRLWNSSAASLGGTAMRDAFEPVLDTKG